MFQKHFPPKDSFFLFFLNCTLLQTTACNGVKHHRNNAGIQQKSSCLSTTQKQKHTNILLVYKSNRIKEYILKSEVKIKWLKNLEEKKICTYIYKVIDRILYRFDWPVKVRLKPPRSIKSNTAWHSVLSIQNGSLKRQKTFQEAVFKESGLSVWVEKHPGLFNPNTAFNFLHDLKNYINNNNNGNVLFAKRKSIEYFRQGQFFFSNNDTILNWETRTGSSVWRKEVVQAKLLTDVWSDIFILW